MVNQPMLTRGFIAPNRRYEFKGVIRSVNQAQKTAVIRHERVGDYMEPMTMPFWIRDDKALAALEARDQIVATLVVTEKEGDWLEDIVVVAKGR
jgi:Cu/Ag efflux protein CusF